MQQGGGPDETRRFEGPDGPGGSGGDDGGDDATRRLGGPDATRRMDEQDGTGTGGAVLDDRYRLEGMLGAGGMADVHRGTDLRLNRPVAVKLFRPSTDTDGELRFFQEAQLLANLSHPGLVAVHNFGVDGHRPYLVMELVEGRTLRQVLDQRRRLPVGEVARVGADLAGVLGYVHDQGVVHRDVTPSNVLLGGDGRVQLADFGISRLVDASGLTGGSDRSAAPIGTVAYMAPEQVQGEWVGPPADVYALGLVLLEAVTGYVEYSGGGWDAADERLSRAPGVPDDLPGPLRRALLAMTEFDPRGRPTGAQAAEMLAAAGARDVGPEPPRRSRAARNVAIALGVVALVAVLAAVLFTGADDEPSAAQPSATPTATDDPGGGAGTGEDPAGDDPAAEDPAGEDPAGEDPAGEDPAGEDPAGDGSGNGGGDGPGFPDLPSFDVPDAPDLPDVPEVPESAKSAWQRFTEWLSSLF